MQDLNANSQFRATSIATSTQAKLLLNANYRALIKLLLEGSHSILELTKQLDEPFHVIYRRVKLLTALKISVISETRKRPGKSIHRYSILCDWYVRYEDCPQETISSMLFELISDPLKIISVQFANLLAEKNFFIKVGLDNNEIFIRIDSSSLEAAISKGDLLLTWSTLHLSPH